MIEYRKMQMSIVSEHNENKLTGHWQQSRGRLRRLRGLRRLRRRLGCRRTRGRAGRGGGCCGGGGTRLLHLNPLLSEGGPVHLLVGNVLIRARVQRPLRGVLHRVVAGEHFGGGSVGGQSVIEGTGLRTPFLFVGRPKVSARLRRSRNGSSGRIAARY